MRCENICDRRIRRARCIGAHDVPKTGRHRSFVPCRIGSAQSGDYKFGSMRRRGVEQGMEKRGDTRRLHVGLPES
jgi:hypothetical protein